MVRGSVLWRGGGSGNHFGIVCKAMMLGNLQILFQILSATLKVDSLSPSLQMKKLRLRLRKMPRVAAGSCRTRTCTENSPRACFVFVFFFFFLYPMLPSHRGQRLTLIVKWPASTEAGDRSACYMAGVQEKAAEPDCMEGTRGFPILFAFWSSVPDAEFSSSSFIELQT